MYAKTEDEPGSGLMCKWHLELTLYRQLSNCPIITDKWMAHYCANLLSELAKFFTYRQMRLAITSGQCSLTRGRIVAAHGRFNGILQMAPVCTPT